jgi:hypothetical protein
VGKEIDASPELGAGITTSDMLLDLTFAIRGETRSEIVDQLVGLYMVGFGGTICHSLV